VENGLGVALRAKAMSPALKLGPQFQVIVDFAVEHNYGVAIPRDDRLVPRIKIDNFQASSGE
jgi:hypothetical protein